MAVPRARLLLIDDDPDVRESLRRMLAREHEVVAVSSAQGGLAALEQGAFDLVVCDLVMPGQSGVAFVEEAGRRWPELQKQLILMTDTVLAPERAGLFAELGVGFTQKPICSNELEQILRTQLPAKPV